MSESVPRVSVILPVYNTEKYVAEAIESILNQTYTNLELIIINDCSTDRTPEIISEYVQNDPRVRVINNPTNKGPAASRNSGINNSQGEYIALMDADDISHPDRLSKQVAFLDKHQEVKVAGSSAIRIDPAGNPIGKWRLPVKDRIIRWHILFRNSRVFCNPTVMIRRDLFTQVSLYNEAIFSYDDFELWTRIFTHGELYLANLSETLLRYRVHGNSITFSTSDDQLNGSRAVRTNLLSIFLAKPVNPNVVAAYESSCVLEKAEIPEIFHTWFEVYRKFINEFNVNYYERLVIYKEILTRTVGYANLNGSANRIKVWDLKPDLPMRHIVAVAATCLYSAIRNYHA